MKDFFFARTKNQHKHEFNFKFDLNHHLCSSNLQSTLNAFVFRTNTFNLVFIKRSFGPKGHGNPLIKIKMFEMEKKNLIGIQMVVAVEFFNFNYNFYLKIQKKNIN